MWFHLEAHEQALAQQKAQEMLAQQQALQDGSTGQSQNAPAKINVGKEKSSPMAQASPLKSEIKPQMSQYAAKKTS